jgi:hypothetical protein
MRLLPRGWGYRNSLARRIIDEGGRATPELGLRTLIVSAAVQIGGMLVVVAAVGACVADRVVFGLHVSGVPAWGPEVAASIGGVLFFLSPMLFNTGWAVALPYSETASRATLLYLRPFGLDVGPILQLSVGASTGLVLHLSTRPFHCLVAVLLLFVRVGDEQRLQYAFGAFGRLITFRQPGRKLQPVGAMRLSAEQDWKRDVARRMLVARLVIVRPGESESMRWEVVQALRTVPPERLLFHLRFRGLRPRRQRAYEQLRAQLQAFLPVDLPERFPSATWLVIDPAWRPHFIRVSHRPIDLVRQALSGDFERERLRPLFAALGHEFRLKHLTLREKFTNLMWQPPLVTAVVGLVFSAFIAVIAAVCLVALLLASQR